MPHCRTACAFQPLTCSPNSCPCIPNLSEANPLRARSNRRKRFRPNAEFQSQDTIQEIEHSIPKLAIQAIKSQEITTSRSEIRLRGLRLSRLVYDPSRPRPDPPTPQKNPRCLPQHNSRFAQDTAKNLKTLPNDLERI